MKQSILSQNDLVRYHIRDSSLDILGYVLGQFYMVKTDEAWRLYADSGKAQGRVSLAVDGVLTEWADHFTKHRCPVTLPLGQLQKRLGA